MANPEHLAWLKEGVERWNARWHARFFKSIHDKEPIPGPELDNIELRQANLETFYLRKADLSGAKLKGCNLKAASLQEADLREADLRGANLRNAQLQGANLQWADLAGAMLNGAEFRSIIRKNALTAEFNESSFSNLSTAYALTQSQIETASGDNGVILPAGLQHPEHWVVIDLPPDHPNYRVDTQTEETEDPFRNDESARGPWPEIPDDPARANVKITDKRLKLDDLPPPDRDVLEGIFEDMKDAIEDLKGQGNLGNISPLLAKGIDRFLKRADVDTFANLDQVRFGVATAALRLQFEPERAHLNEVAQDKIGHIEAVLYQADLITARLPEWVEFLEEEEDTKAVFLAQQEDAEAILEHAAESLQAAPEQFDTSLFERVREYLDDKTIEGYLASKDLLIAIAHKTFVLARDLLKDTVSESRKIAIKGIAGALVSQLGAGLLKLAGLLPKQLDWLAKWMEYLPTLL